MNRSRERAVFAIERWRRFQQARAAMEHAVAQRDTVVARREHESSVQDAHDAQSQRASLLGAPTLDLSLCVATAQIEQALWGRVEERVAAMEQAQAREDDALQSHRLAHARTAVAEKRLERLRIHLRDAQERKSWDDLADLRAGGRSAT